jgi:hypothetical protein
MIKTLLLNDNFQIIAFITEKKAIKLLLKGKAEMLSGWIGRKIYSSNGFIEHPATLKMKYHVALRPTKLIFSRKLVLRRDEYTCCYCYKKYKHTNLTIDHVIPKSVGGINSFTNCVTACISCNRKKRNRTPEQAGMVLKIQPSAPNKYLCYFPSEIEWHDDWLFFTN